MIKSCPKCIHITAEILVFARQRLWGHVVGRSPYLFSFSHSPLGHQRQTKINDLHMVVSIKKNIPRLDIAVYQTRILGRLQTCDNFFTQWQYLSLTDRALTRHSLL